MKKVFLSLSLIGIFLVSCNTNVNKKSTPTSTNPYTGGDSIVYASYTDYTVAQVNKMKSPVILIGKEKSLGCYGVSLKDSTGFLVYLGNMSSFANSIGESRKIGDTIK